MRRDDPVFQLSLTELAFSIAFLLLLLLGLRIAQAQAERDSALRTLAHSDEARAAAADLEHARGELERTLREAGATDPDALLSKLVASEDARAERDRLRRRVADLDARLSALQALLARDARLKPALGGVEALADSQPVAGAGTGGAGSMPGFASGDGGGHAGRDAASRAIASREDAEREVDNLRGQVAYLSHRLAATGPTSSGHGGRDYPPCWADADGRIEMLFAIELRPGAIVVTPAWPAGRDREARALPGVEALLRQPLSAEEFAQRAQPLAAWSHERTPECRHYVQLRSAIADAVQSDRARLLVERYFYKVEVPR